jgi:putative phage-type endonuclease
MVFNTMSWLEPVDVNQIQGSSEWLRQRQQRIGGSEIASVLQVSPYKSRLELWEEKVGIRETKSIGHLPHVKRGVDAEPIARELCEKRYGVTYTTPVIIHPTYPFIAASLDGLCDDHVLEIKTMGLAKHIAVSTGEIPDYYECQLQWNMMLSGRDRAWFVSYRPEDNTLYDHLVFAEVSRQNEMLEKAIEFWGWVTNKQKPKDLYDFLETF